MSPLSAPRAVCPQCCRDLGLTRSGRIPPHIAAVVTASGLVQTRGAAGNRRHCWGARELPDPATVYQPGQEREGHPTPETCPSDVSSKTGVSS